MSIIIMRSLLVNYYLGHGDTLYIIINILNV